MSSQRRISGWSPTNDPTAGWRADRDPIGRHTLLAVILGVLVAALVGATLDPFSLSTADDLRRAEEGAYELAFNAIADVAFTDGEAYGRTERLGADIVAGAGEATPYGSAFAEGWQSGWNDAIAAMRSAAEAAGLGEDYTEFRILDDLAPR